MCRIIEMPCIESQHVFHLCLKVTSENRMRWSLLLNTEDSPENRGDCVDFCNDSYKQQKGCSSFKDALKSSGFVISVYLNEMRDQYVE